MSPSWNKVYCIVLYCTVLYCIVLYCIVLCCVVLYCIVLYCMSGFGAKGGVTRISVCVGRRMRYDATIGSIVQVREWNPLITLESSVFAFLPFNRRTSKHFFFFAHYLRRLTNLLRILILLRCMGSLFILQKGTGQCVTTKYTKFVGKIIIITTTTTTTK